MRLLLILGVSFLVAGALAVTAHSQSTAPGGVVTLCVAPKTHAVYAVVNGSGVCASDKTKIDVNQQGIQGAPGPAGPAGIAGQSGAPGPAGPAGAAASVTLDYQDAQMHAVTPGNSTVTQSCPAGEKAISSGYQLLPADYAEVFVKGSYPTSDSSGDPYEDAWSIDVHNSESTPTFLTEYLICVK